MVEAKIKVFKGRCARTPVLSHYAVQIAHQPIDVLGDSPVLLYVVDKRSNITAGEVVLGEVQSECLVDVIQLLLIRNAHLDFQGFLQCRIAIADIDVGFLYTLYAFKQSVHCLPVNAVDGQVAYIASSKVARLDGGGDS
ncbi:hypothetical protein D3C87_1308710 [compost metagenome]